VRIDVVDVQEEAVAAPRRQRFEDALVHALSRAQLRLLAPALAVGRTLALADLDPGVEALLVAERPEDQPVRQHADRLVAGAAEVFRERLEPAGMHASSGDVASRASPHHDTPVHGSTRFASPLSRLGVRPVKSALIDIVVWWNDAIAFVNTCPRAPAGRGGASRSPRRRLEMIAPQRVGDDQHDAIGGPFGSRQAARSARGARATARAGFGVSGGGDARSRDCARHPPKQSMPLLEPPLSHG